MVTVTLNYTDGKEVVLVLDKKTMEEQGNLPPHRTVDEHLDVIRDFFIDQDFVVVESKKQS